MIKNKKHEYFIKVNDGYTFKVSMENGNRLVFYKNKWLYVSDFIDALIANKEFKQLRKFAEIGLLIENDGLDAWQSTNL